MAHRINERNTGNWTLNGEPKNVNRVKKVSRSFTESEVKMFNYLMGQIINNIELDVDNFEEQKFVDNGNIVISFSRDYIDDLRSLVEKFK